MFLDEIGTMNLDMQSKILRVLQDRKFMHLGGVHEIQVDVRIIAATNVDLQQQVREGKFREDLFYRLNVITIDLPPLRQRREDIPLLANFFLDRYSKENGLALRRITTEALRALMAHSWPGNVRELENVIERAVVLSTEEADRSRASSRLRWWAEPRHSPLYNIAPTLRYSTSWKMASGESSSTCWRNATGTRPKPRSAFTCLFPRSIRRSSG